jgi:hypothetical protein
MSEVDRLSNSGLYPALPLGDQRRNDGSSQQSRRDPAAGDPAAGKRLSESAIPQTAGLRPRKSLIDEYA